MTRTLGLGLLVVVGSMAVPGCALFTMSNRVKVDSTDVTDQTTVGLYYHQVVIAGFEPRTSLELRFISRARNHHIKVPVQDDAERRATFDLRTIPDTQRVYVVDTLADRVILSADFATGQRWLDPAVQPEWAKAGGES